MAAGPASALRPAQLQQGASDDRGDGADVGTRRDALTYVDRLLDLKVEVTGAENIPKSGAAVLVANHPTGIADGFALYDAVTPVRPDLILYANADAQRVVSRIDEAIIPVEWIAAKRTRDKTRAVLTRTHAVLEAGAALTIFPAGRISRWQRGRLTDPPWNATALSLARKHGAPLVPVHIAGPASVWFRVLDKVSSELRDITLFHEMLNKSGGRFTVKIGPAFAPDALPDLADLKARVEAGRW